ncbi:MAG TPA: hypothetical protein GX734_07025 [Clostridiaceae bacterium]|nr:hypothetical protein [Clostridiaceae bacterium]
MKQINSWKKLVILLLCISISSITVFGCGNKFISIVVTYKGDTSEGVVLDKNNEDIIVMGITSDGKEETIKNWKIENPQTLRADEHAIVVVTYGDFSREIVVKCSTSALEKITVQYVGDTTEGTTIRSGDDDVIVTAHYKNGTSERVSDWITTDEKTLRAGETSILTIHYKGEEVPLEIKCSDLSPEEQYKAQCESISYNELARNPRKYEGRYVKITGKVDYAREEHFYLAYVINVTQKGHDWVDAVYVDSLDGSIMPLGLEDNIVTFYGVYYGLKTYGSPFTKTIPHIAVKYIDFQ